MVKAKLFAKEFNQIQGMVLISLRHSSVSELILAIASSQNWHSHQLYVHNVFLYGKLDEDIYIQFPLSICFTKPNQVCKLLKSNYGLKNNQKDNDL